MEDSSLSTLPGPGYIMSAVASKQNDLQTLSPRLIELEQALAALRTHDNTPAIARYNADSTAARFHLSRHDGPTLVAIFGGTGTGKSTLLNRLLDGNFSAASFRRTFTAGAVAVVDSGQSLPPGWLGVDARVAGADEVPARGRPDELIVVHAPHDLLRSIVLIDTPDLDGDQPAHHAQADRAFRWAQAAVFLVTPEKYQMTELPPYYKLAQRYHIPVCFVMNKAESRDVLDDYTAQLSRMHGFDRPSVFCIARDDSTFASPQEQNLAALAGHLANGLARRTGDDEQAAVAARGLKHRLGDLLSRGRDQILQPAADARAHADRTIAALQSMTAPQPSVDVNPITQQLQRRLQQKSVLYLMGPQRVFDRVRQVPLMLARLPRSAWDLLRTGQLRNQSPADDLPDDWQESGPNFQSALADQFKLLHARIDDLLRSSPVGERWIASDEAGYKAAKFDPTAAAKIADDELANLRQWLEQRWNAVPRDTRVVQSMLKVIPGGRKLVQMSEAAPYLLAVVVASHHAVFGGVDLLILGGYSLATWLSEKLGNEVASRARRSNERITSEYAQLAQRQIDALIAWINQRAPARSQIAHADSLIDQLHSQVEAHAD